MKTFTIRQRVLRNATIPVAAFLLLLSGCVSDGGPDRSPKASENEKRARAHYGIAVDHLRQGRVALALRELKAAHDFNPNDKWIQLTLAETYRLKGRPEEAEHHLRESLRISPSFQAARLNLSALYVQMERYPEAIQEAETLVDDPTFPVPWKALTNQGWAFYKMGDLVEARERLEMALEYNENYVPAMLSAAVIDAEQGRHVDALNGLEGVLRAKPGPAAQAEANYRLAEVYVSLGNRNKAVHHLVVAAEQKPSGEWGKRSEDYLRRLH